MAETPKKYDMEVDLSYPEGMTVTTGLPYHILFVGDLAGSENGSIGGPAAGAVVPVNAGSFDELMAQAAPRVQFKTTDPLASGSVMVELDLKFDSLKAFDPANLAAQIPAARAMMSLREKLVGRLLGQVSDADLNSAINAATAADASLAWIKDTMKWKPAAPADSSAADNLLSQLDLGDSGETPAAPAVPPKSPLGALVAKAAGGGAGAGGPEASAIRHSLAELDKRISTWLSAVLHAPQVQNLESTWRSLALLIAKTEFRKGIKLFVLHAPAAQLTERFRTLLIDPVFDAGADSPDLIVIDRLFNNTAPDLEALDEMAQHAASLPAVVFAGVGAGFFGVKHAWQVPTLPPILNLFDQYQFAKWKTLRGEPYARSLGVFFGRCLLRTPHGRHEVKDLEFNYREECIADKDLVWASGAVAAACAVSHSAAEIGWPCAMAGFVNGRIEGFATTTGGPKGDKKFGPTDAPLTEAKIEELAAAGLNVAAPLRDSEDVIIWNGLSAARLAQASLEGLHEISLPYQLFAARLSTLLFQLKPQLAGKTPEQIEAAVTQHVCDWLGMAPPVPADQLRVQVAPPEDNPAQLMLAVTVVPPPQILSGGIPVVMGYRLA